MVLQNPVSLNDNDLERIVNAGEILVLADRHDKVTLEEIVCTAGLPLNVIGNTVSSKEDVYGLVVHRIMTRVQASIFSISRNPSEDTHAFLTRFAVNDAKNMLHGDAIKAYRFAASFGTSDPKIAHQFWRSVKEMHQRFAHVLEHETDITLPPGTGYVDASNQFFALCRGTVHVLSVFSENPQVSDCDIKEHARKAVFSFLRAFPVGAH